jgi:hypothetical protein
MGRLLVDSLDVLAGAWALEAHNPTALGHRIKRLYPKTSVSQTQVLAKQ